MSGIVNSTEVRSGLVNRFPANHYKGGMGCHFIMAYSVDDGWQTIGASTDVPWTSIELDDDSCCTSGTGANFEAPDFGYYFFGACMYCGDTDDTNYFTFFVNGSIPDYMSAGDHYMTSIGNFDQSLTGHVIYKLNAGSEVSLTASSTSRIYTGHSFFYGHRIA